MNIYKTLGAGILLLIVLFACESEKVIDIKGYEYEKKLVLHGYIHRETGVSVHLQRTLSPLDVQQEATLSESEVSLLEDGLKVFDLLPQEEGVYVSPPDFTPDHNKVYQVSASAAGFEPIISEPVSLTDKIQIDSAYFVKNQTGRGESHFYTRWNDPAGLNYYAIRHQEAWPEEVDKTVYEEFYLGFSIMVDNAHTEEGTITHEQALYAFEYIAGGTDIVELDSVRVILYHVSEEMQKYSQSILDYDGSVSDPYYNFVFPVYSNIENGFGVFVSLATDTLWVAYEKDETEAWSEE